METKRLGKYGTEECSACYEIARFKWSDGYICKRPGCGNKSFREGATPYSRQCIRCSRDESVTAHTAFDKLRMSRTTALSLVRLIIKNKQRLTIVQLTEKLIAAGRMDANERSVWKLLNKVYNRMNSDSFVYDESAVVVMEVKRKQTVIVSKGRINGEFRYNAKLLKSDREFHDFVRTHTQENCEVAFFVGKKINSEKASIKRGNIQYRESLIVEERVAMSIATKFHPWIDYMQPYLFLRNGGTYEQLMKNLTCLPQ